MVERGMPMRVAVRARLAYEGETFSSWGTTVGFSRTSISRLLGGGEPSHHFVELRGLLCDTFGFTRSWLDEKLA